MHTNPPFTITAHTVHYYLLYINLLCTFERYCLVFQWAQCFLLWSSFLLHAYTSTIIWYTYAHHHIASKYAHTYSYPHAFMYTRSYTYIHTYAHKFKRSSIMLFLPSSLIIFSLSFFLCWVCLESTTVTKATGSNMGTEIKFVCLYI